VFVVALALMVSIDPRLTLLGLVPLPLVSVSVWRFGGAIHRRFDRIQAQLAELSAIVQEALAGVRVIRAYRQEAFQARRFGDANREYMERNRRLIRLQGVFYPSLTFFLGLAALLVLWRGSRAVIEGRLTLGEFVAFNGYLTMLSWPMIAFGWVTNMLQRGMASWRRMLEVLEAVPAITDAHARWALADRPVEGAVEVRDLVFAYDGRPVLDHVSFRIAPGETVALVGPTGSGKSTLVHLLPRLYDPPPGTVFVDGVDVREWPLAALRRAIAIVPQEPFLFSDTIAENIAFGAGAAGRGEAAGADLAARVRWAAWVACLDRDVAEFPQGYDTAVGERGITLSGGQKQRTAIARALVADPRILVLDDAFSAVDTSTEAEILARLRDAVRGRTCLVVSHRISTVRRADQILVLVAGRIVERGTHEALVARGGVYADLYRKQLLEEELAAS
jgi:ATP-binding cassette subfamily B multidrug efflux pump